MTTVKDLLYLGLGLLGFYVSFFVVALLGGLVLPGLPSVALAALGAATSFFVGAKIYHWLVIRAGTSNRQDLALLAATIIAVLVLITLQVLFI